MGAALGREWVRPNDVRARNAPGQSNKEKRAALVGSIATGLVVGALTHDSSKTDLVNLDKDIDFFRTHVRFKYVCLRRMGYQIDEYAEDGTGTAYLEVGEPLRVTLREKDCTGIVMYEQPEPEGELPYPAAASEVCTPQAEEPEPVQVAAAPEAAASGALSPMPAVASTATGAKLPASCEVFEQR